MDFRQAIHAHPGFLASVDAGQPTPIISAKVKLLWQCNLSCSFCSLPSPGPPMSRQSSLRLLEQLAPQGLRKVHFSGGEVMLHPDCLQIIEDWSSRAIQVNLTSNGTLINKERVRQLADAGLHSISISLDAADAKLHDRLRGTPGAFKATIKALERIAAKRWFRLRINTVVTAANIGVLDQLHRLVQGLGPDVRWKLIPVDSDLPELRPTAAQIAELASHLVNWSQLEDSRPFGATAADFAAVSAGQHGFHRHACHAPRFHLFVTPEGSCFPCCMARGTVAPFGSLDTDSLQQILQSRRRRELLTASARRPYPVCDRCDDFIVESATLEELVRGTVP